MHASESLQSGAGPPAHTPPAQASEVVQALPSSHGAVLSLNTQPVAGLQESSVQRFPSEQTRIAPPAHAPPLQVSDVVQALLSLQGAVFSAWTHPVIGSHESSVQILSSSQLGALPPTHTPLAQVSAVVQASPSSHAFVLGAWTHPVAGSHESSVQTSASSQSGAGPPAHSPPAQASEVVQALPSSQGAVLSVWTQPSAWSHASSVQGFPSLQSGAGPPTHAPPAQASAVVQTSPSSHGAVLGSCTQPLAGSHESSVQPFASSHSGAGPPTHSPPAHASAVVQALASSQGAVFGVWTQPVAGLHESSVHPFGRRTQ